MNFIRQLLFIFPLTGYVCVALASPTPNEFLECHHMASATLQHCLDERLGQASSDCWDKSRKVNDACYAKVRKGHQPNAAMIEAKKKAAEDAKRRMREQGSQ